MKLDGAIISHKSYMGAILSFVLTVILLMYFVTKIISIYAKWEVDIMSVQRENALTFDDKFDSSNGLFIAAAITEYDENPEIIEVPEKYGELIINHHRWGLGTNISWERKKLNSHYCSDEELGITRGPNTLIYPTFERSQDEVSIYRKKFKCIEKEDMVLFGDFNSAKAQQLEF